MQPVKLIVTGEYWDSHLYKGVLYLFGTDSSLRQIDWETLIKNWNIPKELSIAAECAFSRSDLLYHESLDGFFRDPEVRSLMESKFERLRQNALELSADALTRHTLNVSDSPFPFPHADAAFYYDSLYGVSSEGVFALMSGDEHPDGKAERIWDCPVGSLDISYMALALAAGNEGIYRFDLRDFGEQGKGYVPHQIGRHPCTECHWVYFSLLSATHGREAILSELTKPQESDGSDAKRVPIRVEQVIEINSSLNAKGFAWGSKDRVCVARDGLLSVGKYSPHTKKRLAGVSNLGRFQIEALKGEIVSGAIAPFGVVVELDDSLVVTGTDGQIAQIKGEPVNWRVFNKSRRYENQLHVIFDDRLEIYSFNHDYFVDQSTKVAGIRHTRDWWAGSRRK